MASGPIYPFSSWPDDNGKLYPGIHQGASASRKDFGMQVIASLDADSVWDLRFRMPESIPSGSMYLRLTALSNATSGSAQMNPAWACSASPDTVTLNAEGVTTIGWGAAGNDVYNQTNIALNASSSPVANDILVMQITAASASWDLAQVSTWQAEIVWE